MTFSMARNFLVVAIVLAVATDTAWAQPRGRGFRATRRYSPDATDVKDRKLSAALLLVSDGGAKLVGQEKTGHLLYSDTPRSDLVAGRKYSISVQSAEADIELNELIVEYSKGAKPIESEIEAAGFKITDDFPRGRFMVISGHINANSLKKLERIPAIQFVELNAMNLAPPAKASTETTASNAAAPTDDPEWDKLNGLRQIHIEQAWKAVPGSLVPGADTQRNTSVVVAVIDSGVEYDHPDLIENMWKNSGETADGIDNDGNGIIDDIHGARFTETVSGDPRDEAGHGTHCAGTIAATANNRTGVVGVNPRAQIMALRFMSPTPDGSASGRVVDAVKCIYYAIDHGARIISNSWGVAGEPPNVLVRAIEEAKVNGVLFIVAAGNSSDNIDENPFSPAVIARPNVLCVGAVDADDRLANFSNFGSVVDLAAPGVQIQSTFINRQFRAISGTSMATPHVAGLASLIWRNDPSLQYTQVRAAIVGNLRTIDGLRGKVATAGVLDAAFLATGPKPLSEQLPSSSPQRENQGLVSTPAPNESRPATVLMSQEIVIQRAKELRDTAEIARLDIELSNAAEVRFEGSISLAATTANQVVELGFGDADSPTAFWNDSVNRVADLRPRSYRIVESTTTRRLPAGRHSIVWRSESSAPAFIFGGGLITAEVLKK